MFSTIHLYLKVLSSLDFWWEKKEVTLTVLPAVVHDPKYYHNQDN